MWPFTRKPMKGEKRELAPPYNHYKENVLDSIGLTLDDVAEITSGMVVLLESEVTVSEVLEVMEELAMSDWKLLRFLIYQQVLATIHYMDEMQDTCEGCDDHTCKEKEKDGETIH